MEFLEESRGMSVETCGNSSRIWQVSQPNLRCPGFCGMACGFLKFRGIPEDSQGKHGGVTSPRWEREERLRQNVSIPSEGRQAFPKIDCDLFSTTALSSLCLPTPSKVTGNRTGRAQAWHVSSLIRALLARSRITRCHSLDLCKIPFKPD